MQERIHYIDNLKGILIILVVIGHFLMPCRGDAESTKLLYQTIYFFHIPLFVFVSGFLAKRVYTKEKGFRGDKVLSLIVLGILFQIAIVAISPGPDKILLYVKTANFGSAPWYLISLASWYLLTPIFSKSKPLPTIIICVAVGLLSGWVDTFEATLSLSRTFVYLPFFVLGYYCSTERLLAIAKSKISIVIAVVAVGFIVWFWMSKGVFFQKHFYLVYGVDPYVEGAEFLEMMNRAILYLVAVLLSFLVIVITPRCRIRPLAYIGKNTLPIYIFHRLARPVLEMFGVLGLPLITDPVLAPLYLIGLSLVVTLLCLLPIFRIPVNALLRCRWSWLFRKEDQKKQEEQASLESKNAQEQADQENEAKQEEKAKPTA